MVLEVRPRITAPRAAPEGARPRVAEAGRPGSRERRFRESGNWFRTVRGGWRPAGIGRRASGEGGRQGRRHGRQHGRPRRRRAAGHATARRRREPGLPGRGRMRRLDAQGIDDRDRRDQARVGEVENRLAQSAVIGLVIALPGRWMRLVGRGGIARGIGESSVSGCRAPGAVGGRRVGMPARSAGDQQVYRDAQPRREGVERGAAIGEAAGHDLARTGRESVGRTISRCN